METLNFQYCQKIIILSKDLTKVLLCKRKGEADYDGVFSFIGGKMETTDPSIIKAMKREKNEEIGESAKVKLFPTFSTNILFKKKSGKSMILPHYLAIWEEGDIYLNEEYSEFQWVEINKIKEFEPKIPTIPEAITQMLRLSKIARDEEFVII